MENKKSNGLFAALSILIVLISFCMFGEQISSLLFKNDIQNSFIPVIENKSDDVVLETSLVEKKKKDSLDLELSLLDNNFRMNSENLVPTDLLSVALNGGQTIKSTVDLLNSRGHSIEECFNLIYKNWNELLISFLSEYEVMPIESNISFDPDSKNIFSYSISKNGKMVNRENFYNNLYSLLDNKKIKLDLHLEDCQPVMTEQKNVEITREVSHFITDLAGSKKNRHHNVTTALKKINGRIIQPGEIISFNNITAPHDSSGGYTNATIISNGEYIDGMGGGICQASTTLYNAVLLAGLKVKEVSKHSIPVGYVKMGLDSMVSSYADMVFENTSSYPVYIRAFTDTESAYVYLYGNTMEKDEYIVRRNEIVRTIPAPQSITIVDNAKKYFPKVEYTDESFELRYARNGYEVNAYLDFYKNNKLIKSEKIRHEIYKPQEQIIVMGSREREKKPDISANNNSESNIDKKANEIKTQEITNSSSSATDNSIINSVNDNQPINAIQTNSEINSAEEILVSDTLIEKQEINNMQDPENPLNSNIISDDSVI